MRTILLILLALVFPIKVFSQESLIHVWLSKPGCSALPKDRRRLNLYITSEEKISRITIEISRSPGVSIWETIAYAEYAPNDTFYIDDSMKFINIIPLEISKDEQKQEKYNAPDSVLFFEFGLDIDPYHHGTVAMQIKSVEILNESGIKSKCQIIGSDIFIRATGDFNEDGSVNIADVITLLLNIRKYPDWTAWDFNMDRRINIADAIRLILDIKDQNCCYN